MTSRQGSRIEDFGRNGQIEREEVKMKTRNTFRQRMTDGEGKGGQIWIRKWEPWKTKERERSSIVCKQKKTKGLLRYLLESAGEGGFIVSGLMQSEGDGERSRFVVTWLSPLRERPAQWPRLSERPLRLVEWAR